MIKTKVVEIDDDIKEILLSLRIEGNVVYINRQLDRDTYVRLNKALEVLGGKWNRSVRGHVFNGDPSQKIAEALQAGEVVDVKKTFEFFQTPPEVANLLVSHLNPRDGDLILEPSAGHGAIAEVVRAACSDCKLSLIEIEPSNRQVLKESGFKLIGKDFLKYRKKKPLFDSIIMNPPFSKQQDIDHVMHAWKFLKPGGRLVAVMSAGTEFRQNKKAVKFQEFVQSIGGHVEQLPPESFKESGTGINTLFIVLDKPE